MLDWTDLRYLLAVDRARTYTGAARALGVNQSTVTRRIAALHAALGARLIERRGGEHVLTPLGDRLRPMLAAMEEQALAVEHAALDVDARPAGTVRLTTIETLADRLIAPALGRFRRQVPEVELEVDATPRALDLGRREADVALRVARPRLGTLLVRRIGILGFAMYASPEYLAARGVPRLRTGFGGHDLVADDETNSWSAELKWMAQVARGGRAVIRLSSWQGRLAAVEAGAGASVLPCLLGDASPAVVRLGGPRDVVERELWLVVYRDLRNVARIRAVLDFIAGEVAARAADLGGRVAAR
ncbi:MAG TPA: LysR family transcriptional regulator, partial [Haliangiales bacterium]|nr:LysR family transcriptional regulator [Haliangiales bacterium]